MQLSNPSKTLFSALGVFVAMYVGSLFAPAHDQPNPTAKPKSHACPNDDTGLQLPVAGELLIGACFLGSGFAVLLRFCNAQSSRSVHPLDRHLGPVARAWRRPFPHCGVASPQTPTADRESLPATIAQSALVGPHPRRLAGALGASCSSAPLRNCTEAL